jgi:hypothetical protein
MKQDIDALWHRIHTLEKALAQLIEELNEIKKALEGK